MVMWSSRADRLDDGALLAAMADGDGTAASVFVRRHQRAVYGLAVTMCRDSRLAEDIAQQTFERVWKHAGSYDARRGSVRVWILTITRRLCIDVFRSNRPLPIDPSELLGLLPTANGAVDDRAIEHVEVRRLRSALLGLPEAQLRVLLHASIGGCTASEIAELEQIPIGTAKTRLRTALLRLRTELSPTGATDD
jgi:RNA polymerase sigma factor (sigma-70 family)